MLINLATAQNILHPRWRPLLVDAPQIVFLIGLPGSGKSTWRRTAVSRATRPVAVVSSDLLIEQRAYEHGITLCQAYASTDFGPVEARVADDVHEAAQRGEDIIVDRTNMRYQSRGRLLDLVGPDYARIALLFDVPLDLLNERLRARAHATGRVVRQAVLDDMRANYEPPDEAQFDLAVRI